ncbi:hypothetical protein EJ03DRAFT_111487 [Teratosphaeria nubilosa]|uniref:Heterokaryon incompatibility domain-containing protein n=1 Tax=Teratosphaeria nubilosa TaxID=161662 RepID=A0A6G1L7E0_9PEZI|nr:hypothetical protein EJ03DRAFT_111487 [Teratosphaeria nubilosa]
MCFRSSLRRKVPLTSTRKLPPEEKRKGQRLADTLDPLLGASEIRLIKLKAGEDNERIAIEVQSFDLNRDYIPDFCALSYTWKAGDCSIDGPRNACAFVSHEDTLYEISGYLHLALGFLRNPDVDIWFRIDQRCVRQEDADEKSGQIPLMQSIYRRATCGVKAWLGAEEAFVPSLLQYMSWVVGTRLWDSQRFKIGDDLDFARGECLGEGIRALVGFLAKPWFSRLWVVQEAASQRERLDLHFDEFSIPFSTLITVVEYTNRLLIKANPTTSLPDNGRKTYFGFLWPCPALCALGEPGFESLQELVQKFCTWNCSVPSDKVYALLGLACDRASYASPDYSLSAPQVFRQCATT